MQKTYYIDTNILIEDPNCLVQLANGEENKIVIPFTVIRELDNLSKGKKHKAAKQAILALEENYELYDISKVDRNKFPDDGDIQIISEIALEHTDTGMLGNPLEDYNPVFVTNDRLFRIWSSKLLSFPVEEYRALNPVEDESLFAGVSDPDNIIMNSFVFEEGRAVFHGDGYTAKAGMINEVWKVEPKSVLQSFAFDLLMNDKISLVSFQSVAGMGKTYLALAAACKLVFETHKYKKLVVIKSPVEIGSDLGFLPGTLDEKLTPGSRSTIDLLYKLHEQRSLKKLFDDDENLKTTRNFEIMPLNFLRGMNIEDTFLIVDEAQNLTRSEMRTILTRCGQNSKVVVVGDIEQVDHTQLSRSNNALSWIQQLFKGHKDYAHLTLTGSTSRGPVATMAIERGI